MLGGTLLDELGDIVGAAEIGGDRSRRTGRAFTELLREAGRRGQEPLWRMVRSGQLAVVEVTPTMLVRMSALMERYGDLPIDLADASLVALAEEQGLNEVFSLDSDFRIYRLPNGHVFDLVP